MSNDIIVEICVDTVESALAAERGGANRIELCSALSEGGLTPSIGFLKKLKSLIKIPIFSMIRPRNGNFAYSQHEIDIMKEDIIDLKEAGSDGFVFGILDEQGEVETESCKILLRETFPLPVTFHRAFDHTNDPLKALQTLIDLGFSRILTSGQKSTALQGAKLIEQLVEKSGREIGILAGAGITPENVSQIVNQTRVVEVHASAKKKMISSNFKNDVKMGIESDDAVFVTDEEIVKAIIFNSNNP